MRDPLEGFRSAFLQATWPGLASAFWGPDVARLEVFPEEASLVASAVPGRREEFFRGRACLRACLAALGGPRAPILQGPHREPLLPEGFVGSVSHARDTVVAVAARGEWSAGIGVDVEWIQNLDSSEEALILTGEERAQAASAVGGEASVTLVFGAKEAVHKAVFPVTGEWLDFLDVVVEVRPAPDAGESGTLRGDLAFRPARPHPLGGMIEGLQGRFVVHQGRVGSICRLEP